jgi:hypothetical protein
MQGSLKAKLFLAMALLAVAGAVSSAHHFLVASYRLDTTVVVEGTLTQFLLRNPHSFVQIEVAGQGESKTIRTVEWLSAGQLGRTGIVAGTLQPGDRVVVTGNPARNPAEPMLRMVSIVRLRDGWKWSERN